MYDYNIFWVNNGLRTDIGILIISVPVTLCYILSYVDISFNSPIYNNYNIKLQNMLSGKWYCNNNDYLVDSF